MSHVVCCSIVNEPHVIRLARASWYGTCFRNHKISSIIIMFLVDCIVEWWITFLRRIYLNKVNLATKPTIMVALHYWKLPLLLEFLAFVEVFYILLIVVSTTNVTCKSSSFAYHLWNFIIYEHHSSGSSICLLVANFLVLTWMSLTNKMNWR